MILILTMAGKYTRFREFSYEIPKYLLPLSNHTILHYVLDSFDSSDAFDAIVLVANKKDYRFKTQIARTLSEFRFESKSIIFVDDTAGQSETALLGIKHVIETSNGKRKSQPVIVHNIDTILMNRNFDEYIEKLKDADCLIDVFNSRNPSYSYVLQDSNRVTHIVEKQVISSTASSGCYAFKSLSIADKYMSGSLKTHYISEAIANMISDRKIVQITKSHSENDTVVLGTPEEYINSMEYFDLIISGDSDEK